MSKNWNPEQLKAIQMRNTNILVSASAGSGKTGVLVQRLVELVTQDHIEIDHILAMTFSEDAASEMKKRLSKEITQRTMNAEGNEKDYLNHQLSKLSTAHISTIHSFCYSIVKKYYYLLDLSSNRISHLCDETLQSILYQRALEEVIMHKTENPDETFYALVDMLSSRPESLGSLEDMILKIYAVADSQSDPKAWLKKAREMSSFDIFSTENPVHQYFMDYWKGKTRIYRQSFEIIKQLFEEKGIHEEKRYATFMKKYELLPSLDYEDFDVLRQAFTVCAKQNLPTSFDTTLTTFKESRESILSIEDEILSVPDSSFMKKLNEQMIPIIYQLLDCVEEFMDRYEEIKCEEEVIDFSDMEHFALRLLKENPEVAAYYQNLFVEIMVDEFQDSNDVQDELVHLICRKNNVFRVGDVKQSIYGFRHALPKIMQGYKNLNDEQNMVIRFNRNYRSDATIIAFNNLLFEILMNIEGFDSLPFKEEDLSECGLDSQKENNHPIVFHALDPDLHTFEDEKINKDKYKAEYIAHEVLGMSKNHKFSDIAILVRNNSKMEILKETFEKYNIPYYMNHKTGFYESRSIQILISVLNCLADPENDLHFAAMMTSVLFHMTSDELAYISSVKKSSYYQYFLDHAVEKLENFHQIRQQEGLCDTIETIFKWNDFYETCSFQDQTNCDAFYEIAYSFENESGCEIPYFLDYINHLKDQETAQTSTIGKNDNVVRFMSIHNSKGLEFPIVYLWSTSTMKKVELSDMVLCDSELGVGFHFMQFPHRNIFKSYQRIAIEQKKNRDEIEEELRILYVATTRAKKQLHIVDFVNPALDLTAGINYSKVNARKGTTSWILQTMASLNRNDLFEIKEIHKMWTTEPLTQKEKKYGEIQRYKEEQSLLISSPSEFEENFDLKPLDFSMHSGTHRGKLYHSYLEYLPNEKWSIEIIQKCSKEHHLELDERLVHQLMKLNENEFFDSLRTTKIYHEYPFLVQCDDQVITGYIDYLSIGDVITLIDFKSDLVKEEAVLVERYQSQIKAYHKALTKIFPDQSIQTYIYSFELSKFISIL